MSNLKVVELAKKQAPVNAKLVAALEKLLEDVREGKLRHVALIAEYDSNVATEYFGSTDVFSLLGQLDRLKHQIHKQMDKEETP